MKRSNNHYMSDMKRIYISCLLLSFAAIVAAQQSDYDLIERRNAWNAGVNVTGILTDSVTASYAELYGNSRHGDFRDYSEADRSLNAGALAKSITHLKNYSLTGSFSFDHTTGKNMCGSMFIHPGYYPIDALEFTPGRKDLQTYSFTGGIAVNVNSHWRAGGKIDFTSANYTKRKDLRHTNYRLDLKVTPSVMYHSGDYAVGLSYIFAKNTESIDAEVIGTAETSYYAFLDKGLMYGAYEAWDGSGTHLSESGIDGLPVKEITHGVAAQFQWKAAYADIAYTHSSGSVGEKETIWFEFPTHRIASHLSYSFRQGGSTHFLRLNLEWSHQTNNENVVGKVTESGVTTTNVYGSTRIFERNTFSVHPEYELVHPDGELRLGAVVSSQKRMMTQMYPYVVSQDMMCCRTYISGVRHLNKFDLKAGAGFSIGNFTESEQTLDTEMEAGGLPYRLTDYYNLQNEYATAPRLTLNLGLRYKFHRNLYAEIQAGYTHGMNLLYIGGSHRWSETVKLGYVF